MGYEERSLGSGKSVIEIGGVTYDIDVFGMDDAQSADPADAFRFLFQLGCGYMIYLYVIQAGTRTAPKHFFHTFWTKDCAVYDVEMVEHGPPLSVKANAISLPLLYERVTLRSEDRKTPSERHFSVTSQAFMAEFSESGPKEFEMRFEMRDCGTGEQKTRLSWSLSGGWTIEEPDSAAHTLGPSEWFFFSHG